MKPTQASSALDTWREGNYALLTDLDMPEMDGYTLATTIRRGEAGRLRLPILALTANALRGEANRARAAGMDEYLTKPVLLRLIREALERCLTQANPSIPPLRGTPLWPVALHRDWHSPARSNAPRNSGLPSGRRGWQP